MKKNKEGRYLKYALGEIILVVIGILIALQINNWNQERINRKKETIALNNLILDLEEQSELLESYITIETEFYKNGIAVLEHYAEHGSFQINDTILSKLNLLAFRRTFSLINTTFEELVSTGNIGLIQNETLKRNIMKSYSELERVSLVTSNNNTNLVDGIFNPILIDQTLFIIKSDFPPGLEDLYSEYQSRQYDLLSSEALQQLYETSGKIMLTPEKALRLFNALQFRIQVTSGQLTRYHRVHKEITALLEDIRQEVAK